MKKTYKSLSQAINEAKEKSIIESGQNINEGSKFDLDDLWFALDDKFDNMDREEMGESGYAGKNVTRFIANNGKVEDFVKSYLKKNNFKFTQSGDTFEINESFEEVVNEAANQTMEIAVFDIEEGDTEDFLKKNKITYKFIKQVKVSGMPHDLYRFTAEPKKLQAFLDEYYGEEKLEEYLVNENVNEADISSDEEFKEYGKKLLKQAHGDDYDEETANDTLSGILDDAGDDYGQAVGTLQSSIGENLNEAKADQLFTVKIERRGRVSYVTRTIAELIKYFSYTLEVGASWQHEKGNKKINQNPKNIKSLVDNLNNAKSNSAANGNPSEYYMAVDNLENPEFEKA